MLSRHASELYWMARHIERAENTARLLDVTYRTSLVPYQVREPGLAWAEPWSVPLITLGLAKAFYQRHSQLTAENALRFMIFDPTNTSSIHECLRVTGADSYIIKVVVASIGHLESFLDRLSTHGTTITSIVLSSPVTHRVVEPPEAVAGGPAWTRAG